MLTTEIAAAEQLRTVPGETVARVKTDVGLRDPATLSPPTLARIRNILGADYLVSGSYAAVGQDGSRQLRLDMQLQEALGGNVLTAITETGTEDRLFELVSRAGTRLRDKLDVPVVTAEAASGIAGSLPSNTRAVRFYAEGIARLREYDNIGARVSLEKAIAEDRDFPLAHSALAAVYHSLGFEEKAKQESRIAVAHSARLPRESRLTIEAQEHSHNGQFAQAGDIYRALWRFYPDDLDYALRAAFSDIYGGKGKEALAMIDSLKKSWSDPRIDVAEAEAAESVSDYKRSRAAALRAIQRADERGQLLLGARARLFEGWALARMSDPANARIAFEDAKKRYEKAGDRSGVGQALGGIAAVLFDNNELDEALSIFNAERKLANEIGSRRAEAADLQNIALVLLKKGDLARAKKALQEALVITRETGDQATLAGVLGVLAETEMNLGNSAESMKLYEQALAINEQIGAAHAAANTRNNIAILLKAKGDLDGAERLMQQAIASFRQTNDEVAVADTLNNLASVQQSRGNLAGAEKSYKEAEDVYRRRNSQTDLALVAVNMASILVRRGELAAARANNERALAIWRATGEKSYAAYAVMGIGEVDLRRGDLASAEKMFREALRQRETMGEESTVPESSLMLAEVLFEQGRTADAETMARKAVDALVKQERSDLIPMGKTLLCRLAIARRDLRAAGQLLREARGAIGSGSDAEVAVALTEAKLALASGKPAAAITQLTALIEETKRKTLITEQFDARLTLAEAELASGRRAQAATLLESLEWDANQKDFGLFARKAAQLKR